MLGRSASAAPRKILIEGKDGRWADVPLGKQNIVKCSPTVEGIDTCEVSLHNVNAISRFRYSNSTLESAFEALLLRLHGTVVMQSNVSV